MAWQHISDEDLERYGLGMVKDDADLAPLEEHLLACAACVERAEETAAYVDMLRAAIIAGDFGRLGTAERGAWRLSAS
jgi:hypothetical protein